MTAVNEDAIDTLCSKNIGKIRLSEIDVRRASKTCGTKILWISVLFICLIMNSAVWIQNRTDTKDVTNKINTNNVQ